MGHPTGQAFNGFECPLLEQSIHLPRCLRRRLHTATPTNPLPLGVVYRCGGNLTWPVGVLIVTTPHEHDPGCLTLLATAFSQRLDACGALGAHQRFYIQ